MFLFFDFEDIHNKVCLVERGVKFVKGANSESEILNSPGIERLPTLINVKMRLVIWRVALWKSKVIQSSGQVQILSPSTPGIY